MVEKLLAEEFFDEKDFMDELQKSFVLVLDKIKKCKFLLSHYFLSFSSTASLLTFSFAFSCLKASSQEGYRRPTRRRPFNKTSTAGEDYSAGEDHKQPTGGRLFEEAFCIGNQIFFIFFWLSIFDFRCNY